MLPPVWHACDSTKNGELKPGSLESEFSHYFEALNKLKLLDLSSTQWVFVIQHGPNNLDTSRSQLNKDDQFKIY